MPAILSAKKEKPTEINAYKGPLVEEVVLPGLRPSECHMGVLLVDYTIEISNFDLLKDLADVIVFITVEIIKKLEALGIKISKQKISRMWRNAFYCGIQTNAFVNGKAIKGNWEPLISQEVFWRVQNIIIREQPGLYCR